MTVPTRVLGVVTAIVVAFATTGTAVASRPELLDVDIEGDTQLFDSYEMYPGSTSVSTVRVTNNSDGPATIAVRVTDVISHDNGCTAPESRVDTTCGDGEGELGAQVVLTVEEDSREPVPIAERVPLGSLIDDLVLATDLGPHQARRYRFTLELPVDSGNETQSDSVEFSMDFISTPSLVAQSALPPGPGAIATIGARLSTPGTLPQTGSNRGSLILATMFVLAGTPLVAITRQRRAATNRGSRSSQPLDGELRRVQQSPPVSRGGD